MSLRAIFHKQVDRTIEGVIKADDETSLRLELEEYVLTGEVEKRLQSFLDAYNTYEGANGVWISGFFGSGKSHLLKMLALLLENRQIDGAPALDFFLPKCGDNEILRGDLGRAIAIPSKSILFNIDQKADVISKTQTDALLAVFVKVFDEMCGYYGKHGHIAQFERDLDSRGQYTAFKEAYENLAGRTWQQGREQALLESKNIAEAYALVTGGDTAEAAGILDKYRSQHSVSIEDFADQVQAYIDQQSPDFRLNFFVDEVGQYIAENTKLMTNLQTIAESLATKSRGRAWVIVTAQEDMSKVVGEMGKRQGNDFSKIQARFANRMKLTSTNVDEVIQKRLLLKNDEGIQQLSTTYHEQENNLKTLFDFADGSVSYRNFKDRDHFIHSYPFIPYQFTLFQAAITNLSEHNAFEGKHSSVGERSMLGVFQQVAIQIGDHEIGQLATFDLMFEGIRSALKSHIQRAILQAEKHLDSPFAIRLLKALFLVKYVKEFKASLRNLCVLMLDSFARDLSDLRIKVEEALNLLEQQTYIQRVGEYYEYLTDEEKDVEDEIKNTEVETADVAEELTKIIFDSVIKSRKIRYDENGQDYPYSRKLDDQLHGREYELAIHIISPFHEHADKDDMHKTDTVFKHELRVVMAADDRLVRDLLMYKRTEKYIGQNTAITQQKAVERILTDKRFRNRERYADLQQHIKTLLGGAKLFVSGNELDIAGKDAQSRMIRGFHELITLAYPNLRMLRSVNYNEKDLGKYLKNSHEGLFDNDAVAMPEAEQELLAYVQSNHRGGVRTTIKKIKENFEHKPYGWYSAAVLCTVAKLCARGKVEIRSDGNLLEDDELERGLRNSHGHGNIVLEPQVEFSASQIRVLKEFYGDFFDTPPQASEAKALAKETGKAMQELSQQLSNLAVQSAQYPFLSALTPVLEKLKEHTGKPYTWYLTELIRQEDSMLDLKEGVIDPIRKFMQGPQRDIFDRAKLFSQKQEANFSYLSKGSIEGKIETREDTPENLWEMTPDSLLKYLADPACYKGNRMQQVKTLVDNLENQVATRLAAEVTRASEIVEGLQQRLCAMDEFSALPPEQQEQIHAPFTDFLESITRQNLIAVIRDTLRRFEESDYQLLLSQMTSWAQPEPVKEAPSPADDKQDSPEKQGPAKKTKPKPTIEYITSRSIPVSFDKAWLADDSDVERYLDSMRKAMLAEIGKGKRIQI